MKFVILAGGSGTRLWPLSRTHKPKQFTKLMGEVTMYEETIHRLLGTDESGSWTKDDLYVSTNPAFAKLIRELSDDIDPDHFIIEPMRRDTGPAMGYVAAILELTDPDEPIAFIPSDHTIQDVPLFRRSLAVAERMIREHGVLVDIGITPTFPNIHLGYTKIGAQRATEEGIELFEFAGHKEKPNIGRAEEYVASGDYLWHANYYMWTPRKFMAAYERYAPALGATLRKIQTAHQANDRSTIEQLYGSMEKISIDYAVTEKLDPANVWIIKGEFGWSDLGSWDMFYEELRHQHDREKNLVRGRWRGIDTTGTVIYGHSEKLVATIGIHDLVIVDTDDALLISSRARAQEVKRLAEQLQAEAADEA